MKLSKFNVFGSDTIFNTRTGALIKPTQTIYNSLKENMLNQNQISTKTFNDLKEYGFIIDDNFDELSELKYNYWKKKFSKDVLHITILTTLDCNFRCTYCFEHHQNKSLNKNTITNIKSFVQTELKKGYKSLSIDWYGGEPLLNISVIKELSTYFIDLCLSLNIPYSATITTNGYTFTPELQQQLLALKINYCQITLDGSRKEHDKRRILANKEKTYDTILSNIKNSKEEMLIGLRVNVDNQNMHSLNNLIDELGNFHPNRLGIYACIVTPAYDSTYSVKNINEIKQSIISFYQYAFNHHFQLSGINKYMFNQYRYCTTDSDSQYIISTDGGIFKCGESYDEEDIGKIGNLTQSKIHFNIQNQLLWNKDPFLDDNCTHCHSLPFCMGGCNLQRIKYKKGYCLWELKEYSKEIIDLYYQSVIRNQNEGSL